MSVSSTWDTLQRLQGNRAFYEEVPEGVQPNIKRDHVLVQKNAQHKDSDMPGLASSGSKWDSVAMPGLLPEMVADLQGKADWLMVKELNSMLEERNLGVVAHISEAVSRLRNKFTCVAEKEELRGVLVALFRSKLGSEQDTTAAINEWPAVMKWRRQCVAFAHPLGDKDIDPEKLTVLKAQVQQAPEYAPVRAAARAFIRAAQEILAEV